jgi:hypothetical protein
MARIIHVSVRDEYWDAWRRLFAIASERRTSCSSLLSKLVKRFVESVEAGATDPESIEVELKEGVGVLPRLGTPIDIKQLVKLDSDQLQELVESAEGYASVARHLLVQMNKHVQHIRLKTPDRSCPYCEFKGDM